MLLPLMLIQFYVDFYLYIMKRDKNVVVYIKQSAAANKKTKKIRAKKGSTEKKSHSTG